MGIFESIEKTLDIVLKPEIVWTFIIIISAFLVYAIAKKITGKIAYNGKTVYEKKKLHTIIKLFENLIKYVILIITIAALLQVYGIDTTSLIAGLGAVGVVLGLAMQDTLKDIIGGITIILENYFVVGDVVRYNNFMGEIINFGLKSTRIKNLSGEVMIVSNRNILEIINVSQVNADVIIDIPIAYEETTEKVEKAIDKIIEQIILIPKVNSKTTAYLGIEKLDNSSVNYRIKINCNQDEQWQIKRDSLRIIKNVLDKENIKIPYPQLEVHNGKAN